MASPVHYDRSMKKLTPGVALLFLLLCATASAVVLPIHATVRGPGAWVSETDPILKAGPQRSKILYNRGTGSYGKGNYRVAVKYFSKAIYLEPGSPDVYFNRGLSFRRQHKIDEAISDFTKAIQLYPDQPDYYFERCNARIVKKDFNGAIADGSEAIRLSPAAPEAYFLRGLALFLQGDLNGAFADASKALEISPDYRDARQLLLETLLRMEHQNPEVPSAEILRVKR
jgi:tetratricopeptide (TPR) repeat protein